MRSSLIALVWEIWRRNRRTAWLVIGIILVGCLVNLALSDSVRATPAGNVQLMAISRLAMAGSLLLIPGIGTQGGDLEASVKFGGKRPIINASRSILYAPHPKAEAKKLRDEINKFR